MQLISAVQCKNARQLLDMRQLDLANNADVGIQTIRNFEKGDGSITPRIIEKIRSTLESSGVEFIEDDGVKRRNTCVKHYGNLDSCDRLFDDITLSVRQFGGEVLVYVGKSETMLEKTGIPRKSNLERLEILHEITDVRCLMMESAVTSDFMPSFAYKTIPPGVFVLSPSMLIIHRDRYAVLQLADPGRFINVIFNLRRDAHEYRFQIESLWTHAVMREDARQSRTRKLKPLL